MIKYSLKTPILIKIKNSKKYIGKNVRFFYTYNLYYNYWDLIIKFWPRPSKCNISYKLLSTKTQWQ